MRYDEWASTNHGRGITSAYALHEGVSSNEKRR